MSEAFVFRERRRRDLRGRLARATYPARSALGEMIETFPCSFIGHRWVEVKDPMRRKDGRKMNFRCSRCAAHAGFTN